MQVASTLEQPQRRLSVGPRDAALRAARTCYDHLAGQLGVALADAMVARGYADWLATAASSRMPASDSSVASASSGCAAGAPRQAHGRVLCRPCLDWSERRPHLAGAIGAALCSHSLEKTWVRRLERHAPPSRSRPRAGACFARISARGSVARHDAVIHSPVGCVSILKVLLVRGILGWASAIRLAALLGVQEVNQVHPALGQGLADNIVEVLVQHFANAFENCGSCIAAWGLSPMFGSSRAHGTTDQRSCRFRRQKLAGSTLESLIASWSWTAVNGGFSFRL